MVNIVIKKMEKDIIITNSLRCPEETKPIIIRIGVWGLLGEVQTCIKVRRKD